MKPTTNLLAGYYRTANDEIRRFSKKREVRHYRMRLAESIRLGRHRLGVTEHRQHILEAARHRLTVDGGVKS